MNWIEIGSCDYDTVLHSRYYCSTGWGIVVEPMQEYIQNLPHYDNVAYLNFAITANHNGDQTFYAPIENPSPAWVRAMGSLKKHPTLSDLDIQNQTRQITVPTMSLSKFYTHIPENNIHFLKLDTEGMDYEILSNWDFDQFLPHKIQFESKLMSPDELSLLQQSLTNRGYCVCPGLKKDYNNRSYNHIAVLEL